MAHILGRTEFCGLSLAIGPGVFVPRPRAECLVAAALSLKPGRVLDLGCGCGALAAALKQALPDCEVHASDLNESACHWARINGERYGFRVYRSNWLKNAPGDLDLVVAYLPHVPSAALAYLDDDHLRAEGKETVDGGNDGLDPLRAIFPELRSALLTLLSSEQREDAERLASQFGFQAQTVLQDDEDRVVIFRPYATRSSPRSAPAAD